MMAAVPDLKPGMEKLNEMIAENGWVCGKKCTIADISIQGSISGLLVLFKHGKDWNVEYDIKAKTGIVAWHDNMKNLPGWMETFIERAMPLYK